jgi:bidirectional [NiFe] hydrogenase diaphorase subunit
MVSIKLNGKGIRVEGNKIVLEIARAEGIDIPTLCYNEALGPYGACRLCLVEAEGPMMRRSLVASCTLAVFEGLIVETDTPMVQKSRKVVLELLLGRAQNSKPLLDLARKYGIETSRFKTERAENCIRCGLCVRVCREKIGAAALCFAGRGQKKKVTAEFGKLSETCIGCGTCVNLCPAEAISLEDVDAERRVYVGENTISRLPMARCTLCGAPYHTEKFLDYIQIRTDLKEGVDVERGYCPACARKRYAQSIWGEMVVY